MRSMLLIFSFALMSSVGFAAEIAAVPQTDAPNTETVANATEASPIARQDNRREAEIPLNLQTSKKSEGASGGFLRIVFSLAILAILGVGAFIFLRKYSIPRVSKHQTQIKILQQHYLGPKKSLAIVRVAGESILIGVTDHNISLIKSLSLLDDEVPEESPTRFNSVMNDVEDESEIVEEPRSNRRNTRELDRDEEFAISGIKDIVSKRLKGMRSFQ